MRFSKNIIYCLFMLLFLNMRCNDDDCCLPPATNCNSFTLIDGNSYENAATSPYYINNVVINEDCLVIDISASGCDGNTWTMQLIDSGEVLESSPPQRHIKFFLVNNEVCLAVIDKSTSFDLSPLQIEGVNEIVIHIDGIDDPLNYTY